ncbi:GGDEF domain-containing phosphodiesterase [Bradyrhizobium sp. Ai1a-2]|uniref:putative bifunctional diguanylate cyclase/phosphodiesterase n=1 Tax=Bradyrhizobium sp. Ai1a-2 TaxID=196490 RepID=UPI0006878B11|nr:GGDEF domain-containing phosphodiesterase [Bradyrhizobium sp. Ai1a-2]
MAGTSVMAGGSNLRARQAAEHPHSVGRLPDRARFLGDIDVFIGDPQRVDGQIAVVVIDAATPNQHDELTRTLGPDAADLFDEAAAAAIGACLPTNARLYSLSAARFGVLQVDTADRIETFLNKLAYGIRGWEPIGPTMPAATSVGIGVACYPHHGGDVAELLQAAIAGARSSLESGKPWCPYSPVVDRASHRAAHLLRDIGPALAGQEQLHLVYQPKTDLSTGRCIGAEALLRWDHPTLGSIPPGDFVPLVERTTLVHAMTNWTLQSALSQVARWRAAGLDPLISINVSMRDVGDDRFVARLAELLERHAVQPGWINIEVTESALMKDPVRVGRHLDEVRRLGVGIEIDDYGTGQSGLSYLKYIPATFVKIDQLFVSQLASDRNDQIIVRSTIDLVHDLGCQVVAEGIRDGDSLAWLREHGCDIGQGNAISPPLDPASFEQFVAGTSAA